MIGWFRRKKRREAEPERDDQVREERDEGGEEPGEGESPAEGRDIPPGGGREQFEVEPEVEPEMEPEPEVEPEPEEEAEPEPEPAEEVCEVEGEEEEPGEGLPRTGFFRRLRQRLCKTREKFVGRIDRLVLGKKVIDQELLDELEEILITSDLGVKTTGLLLRKVAEKVKRRELSDPGKLREHIREEIRAVLSIEAPPLGYRSDRPFVVMIVGVNGVGKTTTIGKLARQLKRDNLRPLLVAGDTFRAAAIEQLSIWGDRAGVPVVKQKSGSDPSAVAFDAMDAALARDVDVVLLDTAGRMHTKVNLMEELKKVQRVITRKMAAAPHEVFLVLDASTGQNALSQAKLFKEGIGVTGLILTKLDGTAKGGVVAAICDELKVPVRYIGIGEGMDDLRPFDADEFTKALF